MHPLEGCDLLMWWADTERWIVALEADVMSILLSALIPDEIVNGVWIRNHSGAFWSPIEDA